MKVSISRSSPGRPRSEPEADELRLQRCGLRNGGGRRQLLCAPAAAERLNQLHRRGHLVHSQRHLGLLIAQQRESAAVITFRYGSMPVW